MNLEEFEADFKPWSQLNERERRFFFEDDDVPFPAHYEERLGVLSGSAAQEIIDRAQNFFPKFCHREEKFLLHDLNVEKGRKFTQWLHDLGIPFATIVYLLYDEQDPLVVRCDWKFVVKYWLELKNNVGVYMLVTDLKNRWLCEFHHENVFTYYGYVD